MDYLRPTLMIKRGGEGMRWECSADECRPMVVLFLVAVGLLWLATQWALTWLHFGKTLGWCHIWPAEITILHAALVLGLWSYVRTAFDDPGFVDDTMRDYLACISDFDSQCRGRQETKQGTIDQVKVCSGVNYGVPVGRHQRAMAISEDAKTGSEADSGSYFVFKPEGTVGWCQHCRAEKPQRSYHCRHSGRCGACAW